MLILVDEDNRYMEATGECKSPYKDYLTLEIRQAGFRLLDAKIASAGLVMAIVGGGVMSAAPRDYH